MRKENKGGKEIRKSNWKGKEEAETRSVTDGASEKKEKGEREETGRGRGKAKCKPK